MSLRMCLPRRFRPSCGAVPCPKRPTREPSETPCRRLRPPRPRPLPPPPSFPFSRSPLEIPPTAPYLATILFADLSISGRDLHRRTEGRFFYSHLSSGKHSQAI